MRCLGRLVNDTKGVGTLPFENGGSFHIPIQCDRMADGLCDGCVKRRGRTDAKLVGVTGTSLQGMHPSYLHGIMTEEIPFWSHIYDGAWYRLKISSGSIVSETNMAKAKAAAATLPVPPEPVAKKRATKPKVVADSSVVLPEPPVKKKFVLKKKVEQITPIAIVTGELIVPETIIRLQVKKVDISGRQVFLDTNTLKVYDLKCKYMGRYDQEKDSIVDFPDSDAD